MQSQGPDEALPLPSPAALRAAVPFPPEAARNVAGARRAIDLVLGARDPRLIVIAGPCSIHDPDQALEYAERLAKLADQHADTLLLVMRTYLEKPRTTLGWKGWLSDPRLDGSDDLAFGLLSARELLRELALRGVPCASELVDPLLAPFVEDALAFAVIGARTVESPVHRQLASALDLPVGFKNATNGDVRVAVSALRSAAAPQRFPVLGADGRLEARRSTGNRKGCVILRGGVKPNFDAAGIAHALELLAGAGPERPLIVDCSHGNSSKDHTRQASAFRTVLEQVAAGAPAIAGLMLESHLLPGRQAREAGRALVRGVSITDACIGWDETERLIGEAARRLRRSKQRARTGMLA